MSKQVKKPAKAVSDSFISDGSVSTGSNNYMKLELGDNTIRCLSMPVDGWVEWVDKKPTRTQIDNEPEVTDEENPPKKFIALAIIDRADDETKILELTQQSVIKAIKSLSANPAWGKPFTYDINITKKGTGMLTKYTVTPSPKKSLPKEVIKAAMAKPCNLEALYTGEDPWKVDGDESEYFFK